MRKRLYVILITSILCVQSAHAGLMNINPATEEEELVFIATERERNMGRSIDRKIRKHFDEPADPIKRERVKSIGSELAKHSDRKDIVYHFDLLKNEEDDFYNAFAAPGGYVYIFEDLVDLAETDDRIAAVLAHEMGHVEAKHSVKRAQGSWGITALLLLAGHLEGERRDYRKAHSAIGELMAAYSREDEREADELSLRYMDKAGYPKEAAVEVLEKLKEVRLDGPRRRYSYFRSHPYLSERMANLRQKIKGGLDFDSYINIVDEDGFKLYN